MTFLPFSSRLNVIIQQQSGNAEMSSRCINNEEIHFTCWQINTAAEWDLTLGMAIIKILICCSTLPFKDREQSRTVSSKSEKIIQSLWPLMAKYCRIHFHSLSMGKLLHISNVNSCHGPWTSKPLHEESFSLSAKAKVCTRPILTGGSQATSSSEATSKVAQHT